jgi:hypothetical protein
MWLWSVDIRKFFECGLARLGHIRYEGDWSVLHMQPQACGSVNSAMTTCIEWLAALLSK